jgi:predicted Zn-dependent protease
MVQDHFFRLADDLMDALQGDEVLTCAFSGEESEFVRFNHSKIRQAGHVTQQSVTVDLSQGQRHAAAELTLSGDPAADQARLRAILEELRALRAQVPEDPFLLYATEVHSSEQVHPNRLPSGEAVAEQVLNAGEGRDLVGILASGAIHHGFANSFGQRNWHTRHSFNLDWSFYLQADKAVKSRYAGFEWDPAAFLTKVQRALQQLDLLGRPARTLAPGAYRAYLTPAALEEITDLLGWGGFGLRAHRTGTTPLLRMVEQGVRLHPMITLSENTAQGVAPDFQAAGFIRPAQVTLIEQGVYRDCLVSPRSAREYGVGGNGAEAGEAPLSVALAPGTLPVDEVLEALDTGLYVGNLWYLNYSDRNAARLTGMTRFATFWVEKGVIQAPANVMRFDDSLYHLLGDRLLGLTNEQELLLDAGAYGGRSSRSSRLPGALIEGMNFTL